ncbi:MAG: hypothetical protein LC754_10515 [Acidobacteria bacterium]|nr:hypothetical protein [Acidobacteriota bacterium]
MPLNKRIKHLARVRGESQAKTVCGRVVPIERVADLSWDIQFCERCVEIYSTKISPDEVASLMEEIE